MVLEALEQLPAILGRHHDVEGDRVGDHLGGQPQRLFARGRAQDAIRPPGQVTLKQLDHVGVVVDHQDDR